MPRDSTVFAIYAGFYPTLAFTKDEFDSGVEHGSPEKVMGGRVRYAGYARNPANMLGIRRDGNIGAARIPGSIAWFEYSTTVREIMNLGLNNSTSNPDESPFNPELIRQGARTWYARSHGGEAFLEWAQKEMTPQVISPQGKELKGGGGYAPEEQDITRMVGGKKVTQRHTDDQADMTARMFGKAKGIDMYISDVDGKIYRLDVTASTLDDGAHHGLTSYKDMISKRVTGSQLREDFNLETVGGKKAAAKHFKKYMNDVQKEYWNPPIQRIKKTVAKHGAASSKEILGMLKKGETTMEKVSANYEASLADAIGPGGGARWKYGQMGGTAGPTRKLFERDVRGGKTIKGGKGVKRVQQGSSRKAWEAMRRENKRLWKYGRSKAQESGMTFIMHMLGNILELFRKDSARMGGYSTGYTIGKQAGRAYVMEVMHRIFPSGKRVWEFMKLRNRDVIVHQASTLSEVYRREHWYQGRSDIDHLLYQDRVNSNYNNLAKQMSDASGAIRVGDIVLSAGHDKALNGHPVPGVEGIFKPDYAAKILPVRVNKDIDNWLDNNVGQDGAMLSQKVISKMKSLTRDTGAIPRGRKPKGLLSRERPPAGYLRPQDEAPIGDPFRHLFGGNPDYDSFATEMMKFQQMAGVITPESGFRRQEERGHMSLERYKRMTRKDSRSTSKNYVKDGSYDQDLYNRDINEAQAMGKSMIEQISGSSQLAKFFLTQYKSGSTRRTAANPMQSLSGMPDFGEMSMMGANMATSQEMESWEGEETPQMWATPYLSLLYPAIQVR